MNRRGFLQRAAAAPLATAPMVPLVGSAVAVPATWELLEGYNEWLFYERRLLAMEMYPGHPDADACVPLTGIGSGWHFRSVYPQLWSDLPQPSTRAALIMQTVGAIDAAGEDWSPYRR